MVWFWGGYFHFFSFRLAEPPAQCQGSGKTPLSEAQGFRFFVIAQFRPADALFSPEPGGDQGTLFACNVVQGYVRACESSFIFFVRCICSILFFRLNTPPSRGAVGVATFHPEYLSNPRLTHNADGPWEFFGMISPLY